MQPKWWDMGTHNQDGFERHAARDLLDRIRAEYREMPGLSLSHSQAARLWGLSKERCAGVLEMLIDQGELVCRPNGRYVATSRLTSPRRVFTDGSKGRGAA